MPIQQKLEGQEEFLKALTRYARPDERAKLLKKALNRAASKVVTAMRQNVSASGARDTGTLRKSITKTVRTYPSGVAWTAVGPRRKRYANGRNPANYAHLVEFGTAPHARDGNLPFRFIVRGRWRSAKPHPGAKPKPFLAPTARQTGPRMSRQIAQEVLDEKQKQLTV